MDRQDLEAVSELSLADSCEPLWKQNHIFEPRPVWRITGASFKAKTGVVYLNGHPVEESYRGSATKKKSRLRMPVLTKARSDSRWLIPLGQLPKNYYHWLIEDLPTALRARDTCEVGIPLIGGSQPGYVEDSLRFFGFDEVIRTDKNVHGKNFVLAARANDSGWPNPYDVEYLRTILLDSRGARSEKTPRRFYVTRRNARRAFQNELELEAAMLASGFEVVELELLSFAEQVRLFRNAEIVIGAHGAGLANCVFLSSEATVIELVEPERAIQCFEVLSKIIGFKYWRVLVSNKQRSGSTRIDSYNLQEIADLTGTSLLRAFFSR